jgi:hypothetical protein
MNNTDNTVEARFLKDIKNHQLTILRDEGVYRHIKVAKPGTYCYSFEIITWPGWLCYTGDMGSYTFQRLEDMFQFFRNDKPELWINPGYWSEKVQASDKYGKIEEFSMDCFKKILLEELKDREDFETAKVALQEEVFYRMEEDESMAYRLATDFTIAGKTVFVDVWDHNFKTFTHHFLWCCYAIAWTIQKYDLLLKPPKTIKELALLNLENSLVHLASTFQEEEALARESLAIRDAFKSRREVLFPGNRDHRILT